MKRLAAIAASAILALSFTAPQASAQGFMSHVLRARAMERAANDVSVRQEGHNNGVGVAQLGRGNRARIGQQGVDNTATVQQAGNNNTAGVIQRGQGHTATITQTGDNNSACVLQVGRGTAAEVTQTGGERTAIVVNPAGVRQMTGGRAARYCPA